MVNRPPLLSSELEQLRYALDNVKSYVYIKDLNSRYTYANKHTLELFNCTKEELIGQGDDRFFPPDIVKTLRDLDLVVFSGSNTEDILNIQTKTEGLRTYHEVKTPIYHAENPNQVIGLLGISTDITQQKEMEAKALHLANTDPLTQVHNRLKLDESLRHELSRVRRYHNDLSLIILDLDHFKAINDQHGHLVGDKCLRSVCDLTKASLRETDTLGRWGGEEFMIICPDTPLSGAQKLAEKIRTQLIARPFEWGGTLSASFGVSAWQENDTEITLIQRADLAVYKAKKNGRNRVECS